MFQDADGKGTDFFRPKSEPLLFFVSRFLMVFDVFFSRLESIYSS